jgi:hypothetical protein
LADTSSRCSPRTIPTHLRRSSTSISNTGDRSDLSGWLPAAPRSLIRLPGGRRCSAPLSAPSTAGPLPRLRTGQANVAQGAAHLRRGPEHPLGLVARGARPGAASPCISAGWRQT